MWHTGHKRLLWQHLTIMVIDKTRKMTVKGVKLKSVSFFLISPGLLELWRKSLRGTDSAPSGMNRVKLFAICESHLCRAWEQKNSESPQGTTV